MLKKAFGLTIEYTEWEKQKLLPLYISSNYRFYNALIDGFRFIVIEAIGNDATLPALKKHIKKIYEVDSAPVAVYCSWISSYRRKSFIENGIPFFTEKQIYLPFLGVLLRDERKEKREKINKLTLAAQQLALLYLYGNESQLFMSKATKILPYTAMTLSRSVNQLEETGLFEISKQGVNKVIKSIYDKVTLFNKLKKYISNPISKKVYIYKSEVNKDMALSGENLLSKITNLNTSKTVTYAILKKNADKLNYEEELLYPDEQVCLELWKYDPMQFGKEKSADILSVLWSFADSADERIEIAIDEVLNKELGDDYRFNKI